MEVTYLISVIAMMLIVVGITLGIFYFLRNRTTKAKNRKIIKAIYIEDNQCVLLGSDYNYDIEITEDFNIENRIVYIYRYAELVPMEVLYGNLQYGLVLVPFNDHFEAEPKHYNLNKVYLGEIRGTLLEGYIENGVFNVVDIAVD